MLLKDKLFSTAWLYNYFLIILGSAIMGAGFAYFIDPYKIVPGGMYGIAIIIHHMFGLPTGLTSIIINIPVFFLGFWKLGRHFGFKTIIGTVVSSAFIDIFEKLYPHALTHDIMLASIAGGVLIGFGLGLIFKAGGTTGGTDIIAQVMTRYSTMPVGKLLIIVDTVIVGVAIIAFKDLSLALYAMITIYITGKILDGVLMGEHYYKAMFIISDKYDEIRLKLLNDIQRGGTCFLGQGLYHGHDKKIIFTAVSPRECVALESYVRRIDPKAFISIFSSYEIKGEGFMPLTER